MFKYIFFVLTVLILCVMFSCNGNIKSNNTETTLSNNDIPPGEIITYSESDTIINTAVNAKFAIELTSYRQSEEFAWSVTEIRPGLAKIIDTKLGETDRFTFLVLTKGQTKVTLRYSRADEAGIEEIQSLTFTLNIQ
jgi:hypothetical protein